MQEDSNQTVPVVYSVSDLTAYIRAVLESNENLMDIWVSGEISNVSQPRSGHVYFTLKDSGASLRCVIWREHASRMAGAIRNGMAVETHGYVGVYEQGGQYQLYVDGLRAAGEGALYQEFFRLKTALEEEGLFDSSRKRTIPKFPGVVGIVTSLSAAALQDMLNVFRQRNPMVKIILSPTSVQGSAAPLEIVEAIHRLNKFVLPDVILIGRGGGSIEDLWAFNDEQVVRAVANSEAPTISGVGHETDFTLTDFAADMRAPTPTGAAVLAVPEIDELRLALEHSSASLTEAYKTELLVRQANLDDQSRSLDAASPTWQIKQQMQRLDNLSMRLEQAAVRFFDIHKNHLALILQKIQLLNPNEILQRGYAMVKDGEGNFVSSIHTIHPEDRLAVILKDGSFTSRVENIHKKDD